MARSPAACGAQVVAVGVGGADHEWPGGPALRIAGRKSVKHGVKGAELAPVAEWGTPSMSKGMASKRLGDGGHFGRGDEQEPRLGVDKAADQPGQAMRSILGRWRVTHRDWLRQVARAIIGRPAARQACQPPSITSARMPWLRRRAAAPSDNLPPLRQVTATALVRAAGPFPGSGGGPRQRRGSGTDRRRGPLAGEHRSRAAPRACRSGGQAAGQRFHQGRAWCILSNGGMRRLGLGLTGCSRDPICAFSGRGLSGSRYRLGQFAQQLSPGWPWDSRQGPGR